MDNIKDLIREINQFLSETFSETDLWFEKDAELLGYRPSKGGWTVEQVLEHIALTNHFLLILIDKGVGKALVNIHKRDLPEELKTYIFQKDKLSEVGIHQSFEWIRPEHMEPLGKKSGKEVRTELRDQLRRCQDYLKKLENGEGILHETTMSVNGLGKIDVYEYIYFLAQHGQRHIAQMKKNEQEYRDSLQRS